MPIQSEFWASMLWNARFTAVSVVATAAAAAAAAENFVNSLNRVYFRFYVHQILALLPPLLTYLTIINSHQIERERGSGRTRNSLFSVGSQNYIYMFLLSCDSR